MVTRYSTLGNEIKRLQDQAAAGTVPVDPKAASTKIEEYQTLELAIKRKQEDGKARAARREPQVMGPIRQEIGRALQEYAKQKGLALILIRQSLRAGFPAFDEAKIDSKRIHPYLRSSRDNCDDDDASLK